MVKIGLLFPALIAFSLWPNLLWARQADHHVEALQGDYRHDPLWNFVGSARSFAEDLKTFDQLRANASRKERADTLLFLKYDAIGISDGQKTFLEFYAKTKFPPKALPFVEPVADFVQSDKFQAEEKLLPRDIENANVSQPRSIYLFYSKIPFPSREQIEQYLTEAYYGGTYPLIREYDRW